jgi:hypothetical protein
MFFWVVKPSTDPYVDSDVSKEPNASTFSVTSQTNNTVVLKMNAFRDVAPCGLVDHFSRNSASTL